MAKKIIIDRHWWYQPSWYKEYATRIKKNVAVRTLVTSFGGKDYGEDGDDNRAANRFAKKMASGHAFPVIEVVKIKRKGKVRFRVTDGNHRVLAWKLLGKKKLPVLIIGQQRTTLDIDF